MTKNISCWQNSKFSRKWNQTTRKSKLTLLTKTSCPKRKLSLTESKPIHQLKATFQGPKKLTSSSEKSKTPTENQKVTNSCPAKPSNWAEFNTTSVKFLTTVMSSQRPPPNANWAVKSCNSIHPSTKIYSITLARFALKRKMKKKATFSILVNAQALVVLSTLIAWWNGFTSKWKKKSSAVLFITTLKSLIVKSANLNFQWLLMSTKRKLRCYLSKNPLEITSFWKEPAKNQRVWW